MRKMFGLVLVAAAGLGVAQPVAAQECKAGPFIAYFADDDDSISPAAAKVLDQAAKAHAACGDAEVLVSGHTGQKGESDYNIGLSQRMANNVRSYLAGRGVPDGKMTLEAYGETRPASEAADGTAEAKNRRVEITFGPRSGW